MNSFISSSVDLSMDGAIIEVRVIPASLQLADLSLTDANLYKPIIALIDTGLETSAISHAVAISLGIPLEGNAHTISDSLNDFQKDTHRVYVQLIVDDKPTDQNFRSVLDYFNPLAVFTHDFDDKNYQMVLGRDALEGYRFVYDARTHEQSFSIEKHSPLRQGRG